MIDWFELLAVRDSQESCSVPQLESTNSSAFNLLYGPALISIHDYWKNHSSQLTPLVFLDSASKGEAWPLADS